MSRLSTADLARVLDAINKLNAGVDLASLPQRSIESIDFLIPNEMTAFDGLDTEGNYDGSLWYSPPGTVPLERVQILADLVHEHPNFQSLISTPDETIVRLSDSMPLARFHRTTLYNEFYRTFGGDSQMAASMRLEPTSVVTCSVHRPNADFSDREFDLLSLITPHLKAAFRNAQYVSKIDSERRYLDRVTSRGVIVLDENGKLIFISHLAQRWIRAYFSEFGGNGLPVEVVEYAERAGSSAQAHAYFKPQEPLMKIMGTNQLKITVTVDSRHRERLILLEEKREHTAVDFERAGASRRESEVLYWISRGKTDCEIAKILSISPRTVHKHIEHIFEKFGVETRTAAVMHVVGKM